MKNLKCNVVFCLLILFSSTQAVARSFDFQTVVGEDCPVSQSQVDQLFEGELLRAGFTRDDQSMVLAVLDVNCTGILRGSEKVAFMVSTDLRTGSYKITRGLAVQSYPVGGLSVVQLGSAGTADYLNQLREIVINYLTGMMKTPEDKWFGASGIQQGKEYVIQVLAVVSHGNALLLRDDLRRRGFDTYLKREESYTRVIVMPHVSDEVLLEGIAGQLEKITGSKPQVLEFKPKL